MSNSTHYHPHTNRTIRGVLNTLITLSKNGDKRIVRIVYGDTDSGVASMEEYEVIGRLGRSGGTQKVPLLIAPNGDGIGGAPVSDNRVVGICTVPEGEWLYSHKKLKWPRLVVRDVADAWNVIDLDNCTERGGVIASFEHPSEAYTWAAFMMGHIPVMPQHFIPEEPYVEEDLDPSMMFNTYNQTGLRG